ncbi:endonuclease-reverse transcriptase [Elysia marginata]|uniref:Endonuclease-reverse transcriptase n=1 Tax=Elysia marginata TaxID=1093978 RepID=A0AAV4EHP7_9GAST|nr:endonuclease-reverse transcriptase [Elysia marginata]
MWCYRRLLKDPWTEKKTNKEVIQMADVGERLLQQLIKRKLRYAGHIMRGSSGPLLQLSLDGKIEGNRGQGRSRRNWVEEKKGLADFAKRLGSSISQLPDLLQEGGNSTLDLLKIWRDSDLLRMLTGSNTSGDPTSEPYTVDWLKCKNDLHMMANGIATGQMWALQMLDSWGKPESSILKGNTAFLGNNAECRGVHYTNTKTFVNVQGNMCRMSINLEAMRGLAGLGPNDNLRAATQRLAGIP